VASVFSVVDVKLKKNDTDLVWARGQAWRAPRQDCSHASLQRGGSRPGAPGGRLSRARAHQVFNRPAFGLRSFAKIAFDRVVDDSPLRASADLAHRLQFLSGVFGYSNTELRIILHLLACLRARGGTTDATTRFRWGLTHAVDAEERVRLCLCYQQSIGIILARGQESREKPADEKSSRGTRPTSGPFGNLVESFRRVVRSPNRSSRSTRHRHSRDKRQSPQPRRDHSRADRRAARERDGHHGDCVGSRAACTRRPPTGLVVSLKCAGILTHFGN